MALRTYKDRLLVISFPLVIMLSSFVLLIYFLAERSVNLVLNDGLDRTAQLFESHLQLEQSELEQYATIISGDINLQEYLFIIVQFDSGREILPDVFDKTYGNLPIHKASVVARTGEVVYGSVKKSVREKISDKTLAHVNRQMFIFNDDNTIELVVIKPFFYKQEFVGTLILSRRYDQEWLDQMQKSLKGLLFIEKDRKIVRSTNSLIVGDHLDKNKDKIKIAGSVYQLYPVINLGESVPVSLWYGVSVTAATESISSFVSMALLITCVGIGIIAMVSYVIARNYEKPLSQLNSLISEIINGNLPIVEKQQENNEIDFLRNKFVDMVSSLREKDQQVNEARRKLEHHVITDSLTGTLNRRAFEEELSKAVHELNNHSRKLAVCYIDLDQFKAVNDTCGHAAGNELLKQLTSLLRSRVRKTDVFARLGGDEFGLIINNTEHDEAYAVAEQFLSLIKQYKYTKDNKIFTVGGSIGMVIVDSGVKSTDEILTKADIACYAAKNKGRNRIIIYEDDERSTTTVREEINWLTEIKNALRENTFELWAQGIVPGNNYHHIPKWYEILIRMRNENGNIIVPGAFIPTAERYDLMTDIDKWVISNTFEFISQCTVKDNFYSINLSALTIDNLDNVSFIKAELDRTGVNPQHICLEITETAVIRDYEVAVEFIKQLKSIGLTFAIDDFGAGLTAHTYLRELEVDYLKIDGSFVEDMLTNEANAVMVEAIQSIAKIMNMRTIAEYVHDQSMIAPLTNMGVEFIQGYYIQQPIPLASIEKLTDANITPIQRKLN